MTQNGRVDLVIQQLDRIERKLDDYRRESADATEAVRRESAQATEALHSRVSKTNAHVAKESKSAHERISKTESRIARVEVIGSLFQVVWGAVATAFASMFIKGR